MHSYQHLKIFFVFILVAFILTSASKITANNLAESQWNFLNSDQLFDEKFIPGIDPDYAQAIAWGDVDGDFDLDLVVAGDETDNPKNIEANKVLLNDGDGNFSVGWQFSNNQINEGKSVALGDIDGDGDLDVAFGGAWGDSSAIFTNNGDGEFTLFWHSTIHNYSTNSINFGDVDGDGDLDLLRGTTEGALIYKNANNDFSLYLTLEDQTPIKTSIFGDLDNDGDLDIYLGVEDEPSDKIFRNNGLGSFDEVWSSAINGTTSSVVAGDVDGDGDLDLAIGNSSNDAGDLIYLNNGDWQFSIGWQSTLDIGTLSLDFGDFDHDSDLDLAIAKSGGKEQVYVNDGAGNFDLEWESNNSDWSSNNIVWGDVNGDRNLDLVVSKFDSIDKLYVNQGILNFAAPLQLPTSELNTRSMIAEDIDRDGDSDILIGNGIDYNSDLGGENVGQVNQLYLNDGSNQFSLNWISTQSVKNTRGIDVGDVDQDGDVDLVFGNGDGSLEIYLNNGFESFTLGWNHSQNTQDITSLALDDVTGDKIPDLVVGRTGFNQVFVNNGDGTFQIYWSGFDSSNTSSVAVGDLDNDGNNDIVFGTYWGDNQVFINETNGSFSLLWEFPGRTRNTYDIDLGDVDGDGDLDLAVANYSSFFHVIADRRNEIYINDGIGKFTVGWEQESNIDSTAGVDLGDVDQDGDLDVAFGESVYINNGELSFNYGWAAEGGNSFFVQWTDLESNGSLDLVSARWWGQTRNIYKQEIPNLSRLQNREVSIIFLPINQEIQTDEDGVVPIAYKLIAPEPMTVGSIQAEYSLVGGGEWFTAIPAFNTEISQIEVSGINGVEKTFYWDTFQSGFFGDSEKLLFRIKASPHFSGASDSLFYTNQSPFPIQHPYQTGTSNLFSVKGTQVQVLKQESQNLSPLKSATVYKKAFQSDINLFSIMGGNDKPYLTTELGYLSGRGVLNLQDKLVALNERSQPEGVTFTEKISLYHTSAAATENGLDFFIVENPGVQTLKISEDNQLMLLNLSLSLEWDASKDLDYLNQLEQDLERASEILFDLTNGQAALGETIVYNNKDFWDEADIVVYANNTQRPSANLGGIVEDVMSDINADGEEIPFAFLPGQIRMPPTWNRYGNPSGTIGEDWPRVLAHEIGHYALFLLDNYLGLDDKNNLILIDCKRSAMTDAYRQDYSEFLTQAAWENDSDCQRSVAEKATGRSDWETILLYYGSFLTSDQSVQTGDGPRTLPLDVTQVVFTGTNQTDLSLLESPYFYLTDSVGESLALGKGQASGYLFKNQETQTLEDDVLIPVGSPVGPLLQARGAREGDKVCVYDNSLATTRTGCLDHVNSLDSTISLSELSASWEPDVQITPKDNKQLQVKVAVSGISQLQIQVYPTYRPSPEVKALVKTVTPINGSAIVNFDFPITVFRGHVRVYEVGSSPRREVIVPFSITPKWDGNSFSAWGGNLISAWDGNSFSAWGGNSFSAWGGNSFSAWGGNSFSAWGAPVASSDGQVVLFDTQNIVGGGNSPAPAAVMQVVQNPLNLPEWFTPIGQAYRYDTDGGVDTSLVVQFRYLERELPLVNEDTLNVYHLPEGATTWNKLETDINSERNQATAPVPGIGTYALIATIELPAFAKEWNNFGYPIQEPRLIADALKSIEGKYTSVYQYNPALPNRWFLYDAGVVKNHPAYMNEVNNLETFEFGKAYWLYATEPIVGYLKVEDPASQNGLRTSTLSQFPPATYYGHMLGDGYEAGMSVEVKIGNSICGTSSLKKIGGQVGYVVQVQADANDGCGDDGRTIQFYINGDLMAEQPVWNNSEAKFKPLSATDTFIPNNSFNILLPLIAR